MFGFSEILHRSPIGSNTTSTTVWPEKSRVNHVMTLSAGREILESLYNRG